MDIKLLKAKQLKLSKAQTILKKKFVGIDDIIDELIHQIRIWYLMPELITKPLIINLWGMTGVGKTDLVRQLVSLLDFQDHFAEIELSNSNNSSYYRHLTSVQDVLKRYSISPNTPSILFFDEIQKFRTIDEDRKDLTNLQFQDFWELLSDGKLSKRDQIDDLEETLLSLWQTNKREQNRPENDKPITPETLGGWELRRLRQILNLGRNDFSLTSLSDLTTKDAITLLEKSLETKKIFEVSDYRQTLIIISGNLDEAYEMAQQTQEAEVDPDIFHAQTSKISLIEIKQALNKRFKPEQISRLGNVHLIYPSLSEKDFRKLIDQKLQEIITRVLDSYQIKIGFDHSINDLVFTNGVFPVQGVRPVFSAVGDIIEANLSHLLFIALTEGFNHLLIKYVPEQKKLVVKLGSQTKSETTKNIEIPYVGRVDRVRQAHSQHLVAMTSVHEAGHSVVYALAFGLAPLQLKSNLASSSASGFTFPHLIELTPKNSLLKIQVLLAGMLAEKLIFGQDQVSAGSLRDIEMATSLASDYIRRFGFSDDVMGTVVPITSDQAASLNTDFERTNQLLSDLLAAQKAKAENLLNQNRKALVSISQVLMKEKNLPPQAFVELAKHFGIECRAENEEFKIIDAYSELLT